MCNIIPEYIELCRQIPENLDKPTFEKRFWELNVLLTCRSCGSMKMSEEEGKQLEKAIEYFDIVRICTC